MTGRVATVFACLLLIAIPSHAHDIGISQAEFTETAQWSYRLSVETGPETSSLFPSPGLPERCDFSSAPGGIQSPAWKMFEFTCRDGLQPGDTFSLPWLRDGIMLTVNWQDGGQARQLFTNESGVITVALGDLGLGSSSAFAAAKRYTTLGIEHILEGYDHLLFVFALLLVVSNGWMLIKTITAFTVAHSITLAVATFGLVSFPPRPIEAVIALSIAILAVEIVHAHKGRVSLTFRAPWVVAFGFGLLHGFGFAGALADLGLPHDEVPIALLFFNVGVEIGQLIFVILTIVLKMLFARAGTAWPGYGRVASAYVIGAVAMYWLFERITTLIVPSS